jgi:hypothetical protein
MPRFNLNGQVTPQIGYFWYDQSRFIFQDCSSGACVLRLSDGHQEAPRGCNELAGDGASAWAAWLGGYGLFDSFGRHFPESGLAMDGAQIAGAMGPDGSYAIKVLRNSYGPWDVLMADGDRWRLTNGDARDIQILSGRRAIWSEQGYVRGNFPLIGRPNVPVYAPRVADDGTLLYQDTTGRLVLGGKVIAPASAAYFYPDVLLVGDVYHVTWSPSQNDTDAQPLTITKAQLAALPPISSPTPGPTPPPAPVPPPTPQPQPETHMRLPDGVQAIVNALYARHKDLANGDDDQRRELTKQIVEQTVFNFPGQGYGWKSAHAHGLAPSKDSLAKRSRVFDYEQPAPAGALISWDLFNGGTREPNDRPDSVDIAGQYFIEVAPVNHLGSTPAPGPTPPPAPVPTPPTPPAPAPVKPLPDYAQFVTVESWEVAAAYQQRTGHGPAISDQYHTAYRRLVERWTHRDILHDIKGEPLQDGGPGGDLK